MGALLSGSAARRASIRSWTAFFSAGFVGPRFEPVEAPALSGNGDVADGRPQKYLGSSKGWPMRADPTALPSFMIRLPFAWCGKSTWAIPVTTTG